MLYKLIGWEDTSKNIERDILMTAEEDLQEHWNNIEEEDLEIVETFLGTFGVKWADNTGMSFITYKNTHLFFDEFWGFDEGEAPNLVREAYRPLERVSENRIYYAFDNMNKERNVIDLWIVEIIDRE